MVALQSVHVGLVFGFFIGLFTARIMLIGVCQEAAEVVEESHTTLRQQPERYDAQNKAKSSHHGLKGGSIGPVVP